MQETQKKFTVGMTIVLVFVLLAMLTLMSCGAPQDWECQEGDDIVQAEGECDD